MGSKVTWWRYSGRWVSSPLCASCSRERSRPGLGMGPEAQVEAEHPVGTGVEVICSKMEAGGPVAEVDSVPVVVVGEATLTVSSVEWAGPARLALDEVTCSGRKRVVLASSEVVMRGGESAGPVVELNSEA